MFLQCEPKDINGLLAALKEGLFDAKGEKLDDKKIEALRHSKKWKQRYATYLRKIILPEEIIIHGLSVLFEHFKDKRDDEGRYLFNLKTEGVIEEQKKKVRYAADPPNFKIYRKIPPPKKSIHRLPTFISLRPESGLEKAHHSMGHFANTGMRPLLADSLTFGGIADGNVKKRWILEKYQRQLAGYESDTPLHFSDDPLYLDHSELIFLNMCAKKRGLKKPFSYTTPINENNGESIGSEYFFQQEERNKTCGQDKVTHVCQCTECLHLPWNTKEGSDVIMVPPQPKEIIDNNKKIVSPKMAPRTTNQPEPAPQLLPQSPFIMPPLFYCAPIYTPLPPPNACFPNPPYYCKKYGEIVNRKKNGERILGRPTHDKNCNVNLRRRANQY